ncbi:mRNA export factor GLE1 [Linum perenne]
MDEVGLVEGALLERSNEHQLELKEEIRSQLSTLEMELMGKSQKHALAFARIDKYPEARRETDRKLDTLYQRKIAEALDDHLTAVQRDHELKSQIEERRIRSDAAYEEAKRKERAIQEERIRQERAREEAEAKRRADEARIAALEAERKAKEEAAKREASKTVTPVQTNSAAGDLVRASETALALEQGRLQKLRDLNENNQSITSRSNTNFAAQERHIARLIRQIQGIEQNVRTKASELIQIFNNPSCPQSISIAVFAKKIVAHCENPNTAAFACAQVIVLVTSQVPHAMDFILAELHKACIYTVPKHVAYSKAAFDSQETYFKTHLGFKEEDGKIESVKDYSKRLEAYMRLYGALVQQMEIPGFQNAHGPKEGWSWLARFLNSLPANAFTVVALNAFLQTAGFVLYRKFKSQFAKMLHIVSSDFIKALKGRNDPELTPIVMDIESYIQDKRFLKEPEGRKLEGKPLLSSQIVVEAEYDNSYYRR